ncbi:MAG: TIGR00725 family protein [Candidatus Muiribacterium halophilum]|uniref:TIGR00725 family protein n=1 Tax=Muiribacterium halophilum TaxID=2053465 RepID=A0A2N5ZFL0_MUIH1|nr:MAG: TIGR00725 family protein [Candidatus Muirbacterium halophilum]
MQIAVIGQAERSDLKELIAYEVGQHIARKGGILITGGMGGVMEACAKGAKSEGGQTVGILPVYEKEKGNRFLDIIIPSGLGHARNALVVSSADVVIAIGGEYGTLSEISIALKLEKNVITLQSWDIPQLKTIKADNPKEAVKLAYQLAEE